MWSISAFAFDLSSLAKAPLEHERRTCHLMLTDYIAKPSLPVVVLQFYIFMWGVDWFLVSS